jgi:hypothetical protein
MHARGRRGRRCGATRAPGAAGCDGADRATHLLSGHALIKNHEQSRTISNNYEQSQSNAIDRTQWWSADHSFHNASPNRINQRSSAVISGHQRSSVAISGHQRSSAVISGHQWSSAVISGHQWSSVVISGDKITQALLTDVQPDMQSDVIRHAIRRNQTCNQTQSDMQSDSQALLTDVPPTELPCFDRWSCGRWRRACESDCMSDCV